MASASPHVLDHTADRVSQESEEHVDKLMVAFGIHDLLFTGVVKDLDRPFW